MTTRLERAERKLADHKRLSRNARARANRLTDKLWVPTSRCETCGRANLPLKRNEKAYAAYQKATKEDWFHDNKCWYLREYIKACNLIDKGIPS